MKFKSEVLTQASGSIGGVTYSHNSGGLYRRARSIPTNPNSSAQLSVRTFFSNASIRWREVLSEAQRAAWSAYANVSPVTNVFGDSLTLSGQQMYIRCNTVRLRGGASFVDDGPVLTGLIDLAEVTMITDVGTPAIVPNFDTNDSWVDEDGGGLVIQTSRVLSPAVNFFRSPFRFLATVDGDSTTPPTGGTSIASLNAFGQNMGDFNAGRVMYYRVCAYGEDGRISDAQIIRNVLEEV